jgi:hypothetical protein
LSSAAGSRDSDRRKLEEFLVNNVELERLEGLLTEFNLFEALGVTRQELRHSDFLRFLLDPTENHGLGDYFGRVFLKRCLAGTTGQEIGAIDIDVSDLSDAVVERERLNIDVLLTSERCKLLVAIENKVFSYEHSDQLERYARELAARFDGWRKALLFLTPDSDLPSCEKWHPVSYETVASCVRDVCTARGATLDEPVLVVLRHYNIMLGRHIVRESETAKLCREIYRRHKDALDLIFEHRPDPQMEVREILEKEIERHPGFKLDHCTKGYVRFFQESWDAVPAQKHGQGWTPSGRILLFELDNGPEALRLKLIIGPAAREKPDAAAFRQTLFDACKARKHDFPGLTKLYPQWTTVLSLMLVGPADYETPATVPEKAVAALDAAFSKEIPRVLEHLRDCLTGKP